jgi:hypothetical protein
MSVKSDSGHDIARGRPGNPPPVPTSATLIEDVGLRGDGRRLVFRRATDGRMCLFKTWSFVGGGLREIKLILVFQSSIKSAISSNLSDVVGDSDNGGELNCGGEFNCALLVENEDVGDTRRRR